MGHRFEQHQAAEVPATPEDVWAAIATGPGINSWFMGRSEVQPGMAGTVRTEFGDYAPELDVTTWDPPRRFGYRGGEDPEGRFIAYEFLIEGRDGGSTVLRAVTSGFIPGDDWAGEYEAMTLGGELYFRTLAEYLAHFTGRFAVPVTAFGPPGTAWEHDRAVLARALGLPESPVAGNTVHLADEEIGPVEGVLFSANANALAVRTEDAFYRFLRGFGKPVVAAHQLFSDGADPEAAARAWRSWLARVLSPR